MAVFHIKYRPKKISELDSEDVRSSIRAILIKDDRPQSFLFAGPKGSGKTSAARILAKAVNCENPKDGEPCGVCETCMAIEKGQATDIIEIDAASNRGIDDVRGLRDQAYLLPVRLKKKIFIIDEVHMMTKEAFNAMLKLVEEPPAHTIFVMCTTDPQKIPDTVLSRLVRVDFKKGKKAEVVSSLKRSAEAEGIVIETEAMELIYQKSEGSFRNAQRLLMELSMELGNEIKLDNAIMSQVLASGGYSPADLEKDLVQKDIKRILDTLELLAQRGVDFGELRREFIIYFQEKMIGLYEGKSNGSEEMSVAEVTRLLNLLIAAGRMEKDAVVDQLPLELAVIDYGNNTGNSSGAKIGKERPTTGEEQKPEGKKSKETAEVDAAKEELVQAVKTNEDVPTIEEAGRVSPENGVEAVTESEETQQVSVAASTITVAEIEKNWGVLLQKVKPYNYSVEAFLRAARPAAIEKDRVIIEVYYPFHKDKLEEDKNRRIVEDQLTQIFNYQLKMECTLAKIKQKPIEIRNDTVMTEEKTEVKSDVKIGEKEMYDIAKEIFG